MWKAWILIQFGTNIRIWIQIGKYNVFWPTTLLLTLNFGCRNKYRYVCVKVNPNDASLVRAHKLKDKMRENIRTAQERSSYLRTSLHLDSLSSRAAAAEPDTTASAVARRPVAAVRPAVLAIPSAAQNVKLTNKRSPTIATPPPLSRLPRNNRAAELRMKSTTPINAGGGSRKIDSKGENFFFFFPFCTYIP